MSATAYTRFDPLAFRENQNGEGAAAKVAKAAKVDGERGQTFATFATFAEAPAENHAAAPAADPWTEAHEERAAIIEHDGGVPQAWAEALTRLDLTRPPTGVPLADWFRVIDAGCRFS